MFLKTQHLVLLPEKLRIVDDDKARLERQNVFDIIIVNQISV